MPDGHKPRSRVPTGRGGTVAARAQGDGDLPTRREAPLPGALPGGRPTVRSIVQDGGHVGEGEVTPLRFAEEQRERIALLPEPLGIPHDIGRAPLHRPADAVGTRPEGATAGKQETPEKGRVVANPIPELYTKPLQPPSPTNLRTTFVGSKLKQSLIASDWSMLDLTGATIQGLASPLSSATKPLQVKYSILTGLNNNNLSGLSLQSASSITQCWTASTSTIPI